ncbi:MAG: YbaB/EbfC family nucleoid-associated protein [Acidimicrobiales bacterium]
MTPPSTPPLSQPEPERRPPPTPPAGGQGVDLGALLSQLGQVQQSIQDAQMSAAAQKVEGSAGGGAVRVWATGGLDIESVSIDPSVVDPAEVELLEDLVLAAVRDAVERAGQLAQHALGGLNPAGVPGLPGGLGGLLGLPEG